MNAVAQEPRCFWTAALDHADRSGPQWAPWDPDVLITRPVSLLSVEQVRRRLVRISNADRRAIEAGVVDTQLALAHLRSQALHGSHDAEEGSLFRTPGPICEVEPPVPLPPAPALP